MYSYVNLRENWQQYADMDYRNNSITKEPTLIDLDPRAAIYTGLYLNI